MASAYSIDSSFSKYFLLLVLAVAHFKVKLSKLSMNLEQELTFKPNQGQSMNFS